MKWLILLIFFVYNLFTTINIFSQTQFYFQDFEAASNPSGIDWTFDYTTAGNSNNYWVWGSGTAGATTGAATYQGTNSMQVWRRASNAWSASYGNHANQNRTFQKTFNFSTIPVGSNVNFTFYLLSKGEIISGTYYDYFRVEVNGTTVLGPLVNVNSWSLQTINMSSYVGNSSVTVTFRWINDGSTANQPAARVDNIGINYTLPPAPSCVSSPTSPTNNQTNVSLTPTLSWSSVVNATSYDVYFGNPLPVSPTTNTTSTSYLPGTLLGTTTYSWKIVPKNSSGEPTGCSTWSFTTLTPVANDDPSTATTLVINDGLGYKTYTNVNANNTTTESTPTCASYTGEDVWFKVVVPNGITTLDFDTQTGGITDGGMAIYRGTIGSLTQIECDDDDGLDGLMPWIYREDFTPGETIYIRFWEYNGGTTGTFKIFVSTPQALPVELTLFDGFPYPLFNTIKWTTESENNSSHFNLESSFDGFFWRNIISILAAGSSTQEIKYSYIDYNQSPITYYRLQQFDIDGKCKTYGPILVAKSIKNKKVVKYINLMGQEINPNNTSGIIIEIYDDGTMKKMIR